MAYPWVINTWEFKSSVAFMRKLSGKNECIANVGISLVLMLSVSGCTQSAVSETDSLGSIESIAPSETASAIPTTEPSPLPSEPAPLPTIEPAPLPSETEETQECTPGYDPCLPPASDYDCAGGSGNGPAYSGPVRVSGPDIYDLDRDGNGYGCQ